MIEFILNCIIGKPRYWIILTDENEFEIKASRFQPKHTIVLSAMVMGHETHETHETHELAELFLSCSKSYRNRSFG